MKINFLQLAGEKKKDENQGKGESGQWCIHQTGGKRTEGTADVKDGKIHAMFTSAPDSTLGAELSELGDRDKFLWHQAHTYAWQGRKFEENAPVCMHNIIRRAMMTMWLLLDS